MHRLQDLVRLHRMGSGARDVARLLGMSPNTERDYRVVFEKAGVLAGDAQELPSLEELRALVEAANPPSTLPQQESSVMAWAEKITQLVAKGAGARAIYNWLKLNEAEF